MKLRRIIFPRLSRRQKRLVLLRTSFLLFLIFAIFVIYTYQVIPALSDSARSQLGNEVYREVNDSILEYTEKNLQEKYVYVSYREDGRVSAVSADVNLVNVTRARISKSILEKLRSGYISRVSLPLGCMIDSSYLYAKGPQITFKVVGSDSFVSSVESEFTEGGINQTLHRMYLVFSVNLKIDLPIQNITVPIKCKHLISETVILGDVPDAYTNISRFFDDISESEIDDINDFGAY